MTNSRLFWLQIGGTWLEPCAVWGKVKQAAGVSAACEGPGQQRHSAPEVISIRLVPAGTRCRTSFTWPETSVRVMASESLVGLLTAMELKAPTSENHRVCGWLSVPA